MRGIDDSERRSDLDDGRHGRAADAERHGCPVGFEAFGVRAEVQHEVLSSGAVGVGH